MSKTEQSTDKKLSLPPSPPNLSGPLTIVPLPSSSQPQPQTQSKDKKIALSEEGHTEYAELLIKIHFENQIYSCSGQQFEDFFTKIMTAVYGSGRPNGFQQVKANGREGDRSCDGYIEKKKEFYQVYSPEDLSEPGTINRAIKKMKKDLESLYKQWSEKDYKITKLFFVVNDRYKGLPYKLLDNIKAIKKPDSITIHTFASEKLYSLFKRLNFDDQAKLLNVAYPTTHSELWEKLVREQKNRFCNDYSSFNQVKGQVLENKFDFVPPVMFEYKETISGKREKTQVENESIVNQFLCKLDQQTQVIVTGHAGMGKTSYGRHFAYRWVRNNNQNHYNPKNSICIWLPLVRVTEFILGKGSDQIKDIYDVFLAIFMPDLFEFFKSHLADKIGFKKLIGKEKLLIIYDGFDEACNSIDQSIYNILFKNTHYTMMSRPNDKIMKMIAKDKITHFEINPFAKDEMNIFIKNFFRDHSKSDVSFINSIQDVAEKHKQLCGAPLILSFICSLFSQGVKTIPKNSFEIYSLVIQEIFRKKYVEKYVPDLRVDDTWSFLIEESTMPIERFYEHAALIMSEENILTNEFAEKIARKIYKIEKLKVKPSELLNYGIFFSAVDSSNYRERTVSFCHKGFQDFFKAKYFIRELIENNEDRQIYEYLDKNLHSNADLCFKLIVEYLIINKCYRLLENINNHILKRVSEAGYLSKSISRYGDSDSILLMYVNCYQDMLPTEKDMREFFADALLKRSFISLFPYSSFLTAWYFDVDVDGDVCDGMPMAIYNEKLETSISGAFLPYKNFLAFLIDNPRELFKSVQAIFKKECPTAEIISREDEFLTKMVPEIWGKEYVLPEEKTTSSTSSSSSSASAPLSPLRKAPSSSLSFFGPSSSFSESSSAVLIPREDGSRRAKRKRSSTEDGDQPHSSNSSSSSSVFHSLESQHFF